MERAQRLWMQACWTRRVLTRRSPRCANGVVARRRRSGMRSRGRKGAVRVERLPTASGRQLSQQRCNPALRLLAKAREFLLGQQSAPFQGLDLQQRSGTAQVVEQKRHFFIALVEEAIDGDIPLVGAMARVPMKPFAIVQHALAEPFKRDRAHLLKNLPVCFLDFSHHCHLCHYGIVRRQKLNLLSWRTLTLMKLGDNSVPMSGLPNPKIAHLRHRTKKAAAANLLFSIFGAPVGLARHLV